MPRSSILIAMLAGMLPILAMGGETTEEALLLQAQQHLNRQMPQERAYGMQAPPMAAQSPMGPSQVLLATNQREGVQEQWALQPRMQSQIAETTEQVQSVESASAAAMVADVAAKEAVEEQAKAEEDYAMAADAARSMPTNEVLQQELDEANYKAQTANEHAMQMKEKAKSTVQAISAKENLAAQAKEHVSALTEKWDAQEKNLTSRFERAKMEAEEKENVANQMRSEEENKLHAKWQKINQSLEQSWANAKAEMNQEARRITRQRHMETTMAVARAKEAVNNTAVAKIEAERLVDESNRADLDSKQAAQGLAEVKQRKEEKFAVVGMAQELRVAKAAAAAKAETEALKAAQAKSVLTSAETQARHTATAWQGQGQTNTAQATQPGAAAAASWPAPAQDAPAGDANSGVWHEWRWSDNAAAPPAMAQAAKAQWGNAGAAPAEGKTQQPWTWPQQ